MWFVLEKESGGAARSLTVAPAGRTLFSPQTSYCRPCVREWRDDFRLQSVLLIFLRLTPRDWVLQNTVQPALNHRQTHAHVDRLQFLKLYRGPSNP